MSDHKIHQNNYSDLNKSYVNPTFIIGDDKTDEDVDHNRDIELQTPRGQLEHKDKEDSQIMDFNDILPLIGEFGRYQKFLFLLMIPFGFYLAFVYFTQIFLTLVPEQHWCHVAELDNLTVEERLSLSIPRTEDGEFDKCLVYNVNFTEQLERGVRQANESWPVVKCSTGWSYNFSEIPYTTIATELDWVCDKRALPTYAQSIFFIGAIVGGLLFGWIADKFGRIPAMMACNLVGCVAGLATALAVNFWQFALLRFFLGFAFDNCFVMMFILVLEYVGPKYRTFVANTPIALFFTTASSALPWMAYYIANWKLLAVITSVPLSLVIFGPWVVPESARWLVSQGKIEESIKILKKFAKTNRKIVKDETFDTFRNSCLKLQDKDQETQTYSLMDLFKTPRLRRSSVLLVLVWMSIALVFDGHVRSIGSLGLNVFITFSLACLTELPAGLVMLWSMDRFGRRWNACGSMSLSGLFSLIAVVAPSRIYTVGFAIVGRFFVNIAYNVGYQYAAEVLPTVVRAQGVAFIHIMGYVATILAPFVVYLGTISTTLPLIVLGFIGIAGGILSLFLPETLDKELPQTLQDGEDFGRDQRFWDMPCRSRKEK